MRLEDVINYYIIENLSLQEVADILCVKKSSLFTFCKKNDLHKTKQQIEECKRRIMLEKYGVTNCSQIQEVKIKKYLATSIQLQNDPEFYIHRKAKALETMCINNNCTREEAINIWFNNAKATTKEKYGEEYFSKTGDFAKLARKLYLCDNTYFDSLPELSLWKYANDHNELIVRCPCSFKYTYNNVEYTYTPDFLYKDNLIEIKGDHFFNLDGTMCNPFNHKEDEKYEIKHQCGLNNNVIFMRYNDYKQYVDYFEANYDKRDYLVYKEN